MMRLNTVDDALWVMRFRSATAETGGERPAEGGQSPTVPVRERDFDPEVLRRLFPPFKVVVLNNDHNTFDEVIRILMRAVPGMTREIAERHANEIHLTGTEYRLLRCLVSNAGRVVSRSQILEHVWQFDFGGDSSIIESFISNLRKKVDGGRPKLIHTVRGIGYSVRER